MPETTILLVIAIFLSAFSSGTEVAIVSISRLKARQLYEEKKPNSQYLLRLKAMPNETLITILIFNNFMNVAASALATQLALQHFQDNAIAIATGVMTFILLTFGEITPKTLAMKYSESIALFVSPIIYYSMYLLSPFVSFFSKISKAVNSIGRKTQPHPLVTERDIRYFAKIGEEEGQIKNREKELIEKAFRLDNISVEHIMTPKKEIFALKWSKTIKESLHLITREKYSRIPVYHHSLDDIRGAIHVNDVLLMVNAKKARKQLKEIATPIIFLNKNEKIDRALKEMQSKNTHIAIITGAHGKTIGLITMEDILEELVGEIYDESDYADQLIQRIGENEWIASGITYLRTINKAVNTNLPVKEEFTTIQRHLKEKAKHIKQGTHFRMEKHGLKITITKTDGAKIEEVKIEKI